MGCVQAVKQESPSRTGIREFRHRHAPCNTTSDNEQDENDEHQIEHPSISTPSYQQHFRSKSKGDIQITLFSQLQMESDEAIKNTMPETTIMTQSNSFQSMTTHSCTNTLDQNILSHINHNRVNTNPIINELEAHYEASYDDKSTLNPPSISPNNSPRSMPIFGNSLFLELDVPSSSNRQSKHIKSQKSAPNIFLYRMRSPSTPNLDDDDDDDDVHEISTNPFSRRLKRSKSADPSKRDRRQNNQKMNKYSYKGNRTKKRKKMHHAKSKSIPSDLFSESLSDFVSAESSNYEYLSQITHFDQNTLRLLHLRFNHILTVCQNDDDEEVNANKLSIDAMAEALGLPSDCILVRRLFGYMDEHGMGLSFRVFARTMSVLSDKASFLEKCQLSFCLYDLKNDNVIDPSELKQLILDLMTTASDCLHPSILKLLEDEESDFVDALVANTLEQFELNEHGNVCYDSYCRFMQSNPRLLAPYSLDIEKLIDYEAEQRRMKRISFDSLKKRKLRQMVVGQDSKKKYQKKWKKPQFIKDLEKDKIQSVHSIVSANQICVDLDGLKEQSEISSTSKKNELKDGEDEERKKQQRMQNTIDFLYD